MSPLTQGLNYRSACDRSESKAAIGLWSGITWGSPEAASVLDFLLSGVSRKIIEQDAHTPWRS